MFFWKKSKAKPGHKELIGTWVPEPSEAAAIEMYGRISMEFKDNGELVYIISEAGKDQKIFMTYRVQDDKLITDQKSHPQETETVFRLNAEGNVLDLFYDGVKSTYKKIS
jgi:hypothetical protein